MSRVARVTSKGQITIPREIRDEMEIERGDELLFYRGLDGSMHMRVRRLRKGAGGRSFHWPDAPRTQEEVAQARDVALRARRRNAKRQPDKNDAS